MVWSCIGDGGSGIADIARVVVHRDTLVHALITDTVVTGVASGDRTTIRSISGNARSVNAIIVGGAEVPIFACQSIRNVVSVTSLIGFTARSAIAVIVEVGAIEGRAVTGSVGAFVVVRAEETVVAIGSVVEIHGNAGVGGFIASSGDALSIESVAKRNNTRSAHSGLARFGSVTE